MPVYSARADAVDACAADEDCWGISDSTGDGAGGWQTCPASGHVARNGSSLYEKPTSPCANCQAGFYATAGAPNCTGCEAGRSFGGVRGADSSVCTYCQAGRYATSNAADCTDCEPGRYYGFLGGSACISCPAGSFLSSSTGADSGSACTDCSAGYYAYSGSPDCIACPAGRHYAGTAGNSSSVCVSCEAGQYANADDEAATACEDCPVGRFNPDAERTNCIDLSLIHI